MPSDRSLRQRAESLSTVIAAVFAMVIALIPPGALFWTEYSAIQAALGAEAQINARLASQVVDQNPEHWQLEVTHFEALLAKRPNNHTPESRVITDAGGGVVAQSQDDIGTLTVSASAPIYDSGVEVGTLTISRSTQPVWIRSALVAGVSYLIAFVCFLVLRWLPRRALQMALDEATVANAKVFELGRQKDKAESEAEMRSTFLATMSHEIRTPMNAILGMLNLLQITEQTARQRDYTEKATAAAQSLLGLINDILDFSKIDAGKLELDSQPFRLDQLMRHLGMILSANLGKKPVELLFDIDPQLPKTAVGDSMRLQQVLINLGGNAVKFSHHGQIVIAMRQMSRSEASVTVEFSVQDSGIGIAEEHQKNIFSSFSQAESSTTRRFGGTGLGLSISNRLVHLMGGDIRLTSTLGVGSTFAFTLELPLAGDVPAPAPRAHSPELEGMRVLVVDDNEIAAELMRRMAESWKWRADVALSGEQALQMIQEALAAEPGAFPYAVIYMDWQMPESDGWETARCIHQIARKCAGDRPSIIMVTAHGREILAHRSAEEQALLSGYLVKPITASMLLDAVADANAGNTGLRQWSTPRVTQRQLAGMRILVVEDNLINQQVADELLSSEGAIVSLAANGQQGVEAVAAAAPQFDVVLMDIQMPVLDGYGATQLIREELRLLNLPIVAMTANALATDREACLQAGMNEHVGKPFDMAKLVSLLIRVTGYQASLESITIDALPAPRAAELIEVPGLDLATALSRMSGMRSLYVRTARDFSKVLATSMDELRNLLKSSDQKTFMMRLHTLKGNAATLGLMNLSRKAAELETLYKSAERPEQCADALDALGRLVGASQDLLNAAIAQLAGNEPAVATPKSIEKPSAELMRAMRELDDLLASSDMEALGCFATLRDALEQTANPHFAALENAMQELEFELAHGACQAILKSWDEA